MAKKRLSPPPTPNTPEEPKKPRWELTITPTEGLEGQVAVHVHEQAVTCGEVAHVLAKVLVAISRTPMQTIPTVDEVKAEAALQQLAKDHPATHFYGRAGQQLFLGDNAAQQFGASLVEQGWVDLGAPPEGVKRPCEFQRLGNDAFRKMLSEGNTTPEA